MADAKKTAKSVKAAAAEVKAEAAEKAEKVVKEVKKTATKATNAAKKVAEKAAEKKPAAKKSAKKPVEKKDTVMVQFGTKEVLVDSVVEAAKADFKANNKGYIKTLNVYIKPEDDAAYYVVNGKVSGKIAL